MVVLNEKDIGFVPPPPYFAIENDHRATDSSSPGLSSTHLSNTHTFASSSSSSTPHSSRTPHRAPTLPSHVLLLIVYSTLPRLGEYRRDPMSGKMRRESTEEMAVRTTRTLYWMAFCLRAVSKGFYLSAMHLLRSTFLPHYMQRIRPPYTSDPFPHTSLSSNSPSTSDASSSSRYGVPGSRSVVASMQCESEVLDLYILHQLHEDVFSDDTSLHTARPERLRDLFDFMQPRARLMDLVRAYGAGAGLIALSESESTSESGSESALEDESDGDLDNENFDSSFSYTHADAENKRSQVGLSSGLGLKSKLTRSTSTLTLINPSSSPPSSSTSTSTHERKVHVYSPSSFRCSTPVEQRSLGATASLPAARARRGRERSIPYAALRVSFSPRRVGVVYSAPAPAPAPSPAHMAGSSTSTSGRTGDSSSRNVSGSGSGPGPRTIVDLPREREEPLERSASRLVMGLKAWMDSNGFGVRSVRSGSGSGSGIGRR